MARLTAPGVAESTGVENAPAARAVIVPETAAVFSTGVVMTTGAPPRLVAATVKAAAPLKAEVVFDGATITCGIPVASPVRPPAANIKPPV